jgi:hypothetical protein
MAPGSINKITPNTLIHASSPYLRQHAHNPVDWLLWGEKALRRARNEDKPLLISIGYAACHWCHVMAHESFEDEDIAAIMNAEFVCVKVDREERPDIDQIYMEAVQAISGGGGWPLNCFALPDGRPFYGGTYFHKDDWRRVLLAIAREYRQNKPALEQFAENLAKGISDPLPFQAGEATRDFSREKLSGMLAAWKLSFDPRHGSEQRAPKFPMPVNLRFLLEYALLSGDTDALGHVRLTLDAMAAGGIYDQVGGGFARYSTDSQWKVPHFEKMLYDNAQLAGLYSRAWQVFSVPRYAEVARETLAFLLRELYSPDGLFYSSLDADSEGEEGKFYTWTLPELRSVLGDDYDITRAVFALDEQGHWEDGRYILLRATPLTDAARESGFSEEELTERFSRVRQRLFQARECRPRPGLDNKVLASWNGLAIRALAEAYRAFGDESHLRAAERAAEFILENMSAPDGGLYHAFYNGRADIPAFLEDYAFLAEGLLVLYQATFNERWAQAAKSLCEQALEHFFDENSGFLFFTPRDQTDLFTRKSEVIDGVMPSSNSSMALILFCLARLYGQPRWEDIALDMLAKLEDQLLHNPGSFSRWAELYLHQVYPFRELVIAGEDAQTIRKTLDGQALPNLLLAGGAQPGDMPILTNRFQPGKTLMYICQNQTCSPPIEDLSNVLAAMGLDQAD